MTILRAVIGATILIGATTVGAQEGPVSSPETAALTGTPIQPAGLEIPALTPVTLVIKKHLGSKVSVGGEMFDIELAEPIIVGGQIIVPAGTPGVGEVVHAKRAGGSGASGELVLAARYLQIGDRRLRLRSLHFAQAGKDSIGTVNALSPVPAVGMVGFLVKGKEVDLPAGTVVSAKTAEVFVLEASPAQPVPGPSAAPTRPPDDPAGSHIESSEGKKR